MFQRFGCFLGFSLLLGGSGRLIFGATHQYYIIIPSFYLGETHDELFTLEWNDALFLGRRKEQRSLRFKSMYLI